jgi:hypothetical protein
MNAFLLPLAIDGFRVFFAVVIVVAVVTIAGVIITNTPDVDSMADPTPRLDEPPGPYEHRGAYASSNLPQVPPDVMARIDKGPWPDRSEWGQS